MSDSSKDDISALLDDVVEASSREQRVLSQLLEKLHFQANHHLVLQVRMGEVSSYLTSVTLGWVAEKVRFAADLPIFRANSDEHSKRIQVSPGALEEIQQRQPDWRRQPQMATYLAVREHHKFPPLLLVGYQQWVYKERDEKWGIDAKAMDESLTLRGLEPTGTYWDLDDTGTEFYALDGQHRLMAILGLRDLIQKGQLNELDERGRLKKGKILRRDDIVDYIHSGTGESQSDIHERLQHLMDERIGVEIVPAVCAGEGYLDALRRLRQMFVDVNENAKVLKPSELVQLDETNGYRVVSRRLIAEHDLLRSSVTAEGEERVKVDITRTTLPENSDCYTTLKTLADIVRRYLTENKTLPDSSNYTSWGNFIAKEIFVRPEDSVLNRGQEAMIEYFNYLAKIPSHIAFIQGKPAGELRKSKDGDDNILFRPLVQTALAEAIGKLVSRGVSLQNIFEEISRQELLGQLKLTERTSPWFGVLCDPAGHKMRRHKKNEDLCCRLFQYLLGGGLEDDIDRENLREDFATERQIDQESGLAIDIEGNQVQTGEVRLPNPWR